MTTTSCKACSALKYSKGYCHPHYDQMRLYGELRAVKGRPRYSNVSDEILLNKLREYVAKHGTLNVAAFTSVNGLPDRTTYKRRFGTSKMHELAELAGIELSNQKHGFGNSIGQFKSQKEFEIANWLDTLNVSYKYEVTYGVGNYTFDFYLPAHDLYIEYYGIETDEYLTRVENKRKLYGNRRVLELTKAMSLTQLKEALYREQFSWFVAMRDPEIENIEY